MTKIFFDCEFTGLDKNPELISIGLVSEDQRSFYAEFTDYNHQLIEDKKWLNEHVINQLLSSRYGTNPTYINLEDICADEMFIGDSKLIRDKLFSWLCQFDHIELWSDCYAYDIYLFNSLFGGAFSIPDNIYYIPFDLATAFKMKGIDPDINREKFAGLENSKDVQKHLSIWDAYVIKTCYEKLEEMNHEK